MKLNQPVTELIRQRRSVRNYLPKEFDTKTKDQVREILSRYTSGPMGNKVAFHLVKRNASTNGQRLKIGTYGFIKGAQYFIVGTMNRDAFAEEDYGFLLEQIILHMHDMGLGTCWLGGTFKRSDFTRLLGHSDDTFIPAVTPVGHPASSMSNRERLIRKGAGSDQRKPWEELFFEMAFDQPLQRDAGSEHDRLLLEMVRLAPSASNKQPWRIVRGNNVFHFFLQRTPGYGGFVKDVDLQRIDMGIAMAHFELTARTHGAAGGWKVMDPHPVRGAGSSKAGDHAILPNDNTLYIVSWVQQT